MEPLWVLLPFGAGAIPALLYLRSRNEIFPALQIWVIAWIVIWATGILVSLGDGNSLFYVASNYLGPYFTALLLAGSYRFLERPIPRWLAPTTIAISMIAGTATLSSNATGAIVSSLLEAPLAALAGTLILLASPRPGIISTWLGVLYLGIAILTGLDWIGQVRPDTGEAVFIAWMGMTVTGCFTQALAFAEVFRKEAKRLTRERDLLRSIARVAVGREGTLDSVNAALDELPRFARLAAYGVWRLNRRGELRYVAGHTSSEFKTPAELANPNDTHPLLAAAALQEDPIFVGDAGAKMSPPLLREGFENGFVAPLRAGGELVGVMGGVLERDLALTPAHRRFISDLSEEIGFVLAYLGIRRSQQLAVEQREIEARQLRAMIEAVPAGVLLLSRELEIELMSPLMSEHLLCGAPEVWVGRPAGELRARLLQTVPKEMQEALENASDSVGNAQGLPNFEAKNEKGVLLWVTAHPVTDHDGRQMGWVWMTRDVTEERSLAERVQFAERMQTVETLAGGLAQDFNNQLTAILGNASFLQDELGDRTGARETLLDLARSAEHCAELTRGLLTFTRQDETEVQPVRLAEVLSQVALLMRPSMAPEITFDVELADDLGWVDADAAQLRRIVTNLLANARDAVVGRGRIQLSAGRSEHEDTFWIEVRDDGAGMSRDVQRRIFEPFFTTKETGRGTGLGLAIVYGIVESNGGHIAVESDPGGGSCFRLTWPARDAPPLVLDAPPVSSPSARGTVLLAEDEPSVRRLVRRALEQAGYAVEEVADGDAAVALFREQGKNFQLALLDLSMPGRNGLEVLDDIRRDAPDLPVLIVSGHPDREHLSWPEGVPILPKPFSPRTLVNRVGELLESSADSD